jgi:preprotein translocase subunit SecF
MKRIIRFSRFFIPAAIISLAIIIVGVVGYVMQGGFNLGVDFKAGLMQEVQAAPSALSLTYSGTGNATINYSTTGINIIITGTANENVTHSFPFAEFATLDSLSSALREQVSGLGVELNDGVAGDTSSTWLLQSAQGNPQLGSTPFILHYLRPDSEPIDIADVRAALSSLGTASVQVLGEPSERRFMIRIDEDENADADSSVSAEKVLAALNAKFGDGEIAVITATFVGSQFSRQLQSQAALLLILTLGLIFIYCAIRFKPKFAAGAVLAIAHDAFIMIAFITWTRLEFNTTTIAAILTILGYSINDTIVIFDRIRETQRLYDGDSYENILNRAITETLSRTIITTATTMLAVLSLYIFTTGSMKDFALALLVGMLFGCYSTIYVASGCTLFWDKHISGKFRRKKAVPVVTA